MMHAPELRGWCGCTRRYAAILSNTACGRPNSGEAHVIERHLWWEHRRPRRKLSSSSRWSPNKNDDRQQRLLGGSEGMVPAVSPIGHAAAPAASPIGHAVAPAGSERGRSLRCFVVLVKVLRGSSPRTSSRGESNVARVSLRPTSTPIVRATLWRLILHSSLCRLFLGPMSSLNTNRKATLAEFLPP